MTDPQASPPTPTPTQRAWGVAAATTIIAAFPAFGALLTGTPAEQRGGAYLAVLQALAIVALALGRRNPRALPGLCFIISLEHAVWGLLLLRSGTGTLAVVGVLVAIFSGGWIVAGILFVAAGRGGQGPGS